MIDRAQQPVNGPSLDFQTHLAVLENNGLLVRIDRPINKDTELHPLVRWQFLGGIPEDERRAFLFTNVVDSRGRRYDIPVVVGALAASPKNLCDRHGVPGRGDRRRLDARDRQSHRSGRREFAALPGSGHRRVTICGSPAEGWRACRCRFPRRASTPRPISPPRFASRAIPKPGCATWGPTAPR